MGEVLRLAGLLLACGLGLFVSALGFARLARRGREIPVPVRVPVGAILAAGAAFLGTQYLLDEWIPTQENPAHPANLARVIGALAVALLVMRVGGGNPRWFLPLPERRPMHYALRAYATALPALVGVYLLYLETADWAGFEPQHEILAGFGRLARAEQVLTLALAVVVMPVIEEAVFRGYLFAGLAADPRFGPMRALAFSSLAFGLAHHPTMWLPATCLGVLFGWVQWRMGDLRGPMMLHVLNNVVVFGMSAVS